MRDDALGGGRHADGMDAPTDDDLFLDAVDTVVLEALARIGDDHEAAFRFFLRLLALAATLLSAGLAAVHRPESGRAALRIALRALLLPYGADDDFLGRECIDRQPAAWARDGRSSDQPGLRHFKPTRCTLRHPEFGSQWAARPCAQ